MVKIFDVSSTSIKFKCQMLTAFQLILTTSLKKSKLSILTFPFFCTVLLLSFSVNPLFSQETIGTLKEVIDTIPAPKKVKKKFTFKNYWKADYPSPKKAITLAIIPGMGQIYNKKYWKLPLVYGALGGVIYSINWNTERYNLFRKVHDVQINGETSMYLAEVQNSTLLDAPNAAIRSRRDSFDKNRQLSWIGLIAFYLISAGDAFVDAHLKDFNIDDDISFQPSFQTDHLQPASVGVSIKININ